MPFALGCFIPANTDNDVSYGYVLKIMRLQYSFIIKLIIFVLAVFVNNAVAGLENTTNQRGAVGSLFPRIAEPMVFDLVRPLGAMKGELEFNTLAVYSIKGNVEWAPEIEYAVRDGLAVELELPFENSKLEEYKVAIQGTLQDHSEDFVHGWQAISHYQKKEQSYSADALYISGYSFDRHWSTLTMAGLRINEISRHDRIDGLVNLNLNYRVNEKLGISLEIDNDFNKNRWNALAIPQGSFNLMHNLSIQAGTGFLFANARYSQWTVSSRISYAF